MRNLLPTLSLICGLAAALPAAEGGLSFKRVLDTPYPKHTGTSSGDLAIGDINGDGRKDLVVAGTSEAKPSLRFWLQKPDGTFALAAEGVEVAGLPGLLSGCNLRLADLDKDGDLDLVVCGKTGPAASTALLRAYLNDGKGRFTQGCDLGAQLPSEDFDDVPGSWGKAGTAPDNQSDEGVKGIYNFNGWSRGALELADLDKDGDLDLVVAGTKGMEGGTDPAGQAIQRDWETAAVFLNDGKGGFTLLNGPGFPKAGVPADPERQPERIFPGLPKVQRAAMAIADFNGDGKPDVALMGQANIGPKANAGIPESQRNGGPLAEVLLGKGDGTFAPVANPGLIAMIDGALVALDIDGDGRMDLAAMGSTGHPKDPDGGRCCRIWLGKGDGTFAEDKRQVWQRAPGAAEGLTPMMSGDLAFGDLDGDGDLDLVMGGNANDRALCVYRNDGGKLLMVDLSKAGNGIGSNDLKGGAESDASAECDLRIEDLDGDGKPDLVVNGRGGSNQLLVFINQRK
ncbi:MAG: VCBS repeat-containing protein [Planctomycetes bacterium]|nr:VCBS repeat-containing protein [Planctomycetota bacterium]